MAHLLPFKHSDDNGGKAARIWWLFDVYDRNIDRFSSLLNTIFVVAGAFLVVVVFILTPHGTIDYGKIIAENATEPNFILCFLFLILVFLIAIGNLAYEKDFYEKSYFEKRVKKLHIQNVRGKLRMMVYNILPKILDPRPARKYFQKRIRKLHKRDTMGKLKTCAEVMI